MPGPIRRGEGASSGENADSTPDELTQIIEQAPDESTDTVDTPTRTRGQGWSRLLQGNRVIWVIAVVAVVALVGGLVLGRFVISPGQAAADATAPDAGLITVPVENRVLANDVTIRGDATFADSVDVTVETGEIGGPAVVTGQVPAAGATFSPLSVALEVAGRPVIVLPGDLPVYRTLRVGVSGPDVTQLKQALSAVGIDPGNLDSNAFDASTAAAIDALYAAVGYPSPSSPEGTGDTVRAATDAVTSAEEQIASAQRALNVAAAGPSQADRTRLQIAINDAQGALDEALAGGNPREVQAARDALYLAIVERDAALGPVDASAEQASLNAAHQQLASAQEQLVEAQEGTLAFLPSSEVLFLSGLPRRVDEISVQRGSTISAAVMKVSGAKLEISGSASESDARLLEVGDRAVLAMPDDSELGATVTAVAPAEAAEGEAESAGRWQVLFEPDELTPEQLQLLQGTNVRVNIPVSSTDGEVLAVPLAALTAGAGGESRVEIRTGQDEETELVQVETGLAAGGYVEITPVDGQLEVGDLVVVGR